MAASPDCRIGVVVITHNRCRELMHTLKRMTALPERPKIIVVDNASSDDTCAEAAKCYPEVALLRQSRNLGSAARTLGARALNVPYIAFCDDDAWWEPGSLSRAADLLDLHPRVGLLNARVLVGPEGSLDPTCLAMAASPLAAEEGLPGPSLLGFLASAAVVRRSAFFECGGFDARLFLGGEEQLLAVDLATRGWRLSYVPQLVVRHYPSPRRDAHNRRRLELRNALWFAWLRRPWKSALRRSVQLIGAAPPSAAVKGALQALAGLPWIWRRRHVVSAEVERGLSRLDAWNSRREGGQEQHARLGSSPDIPQPRLERQFLATASSGDPAAEARE